MELFSTQYETELMNIESLLPNNKPLMHRISLVIRNKLRKNSNEKNLVIVLNGINKVMSLFIKDISFFEEEIKVADFYISLLIKYAPLYTNINVEQLFIDIREKIERKYIESLYENHWKQINPYFRSEYKDEELYKKDIIALIDEVITNVEKECPDKFFIYESDIKRFVRGRRGKSNDKNYINAPSIEIAIKNNLINRWNPPGKRYLYLVASIENENENLDEVCLEELRAKDLEVFTVGDFKIKDIAKKNKLINLDYENISFESITSLAEVKLENKKNAAVDEIIKQYPFDLSELDSRIKSITEVQYNDVRNIATEYTGLLFLKYLCDVIFKPLDKDQDSDPLLKDSCYKSFHLVAEHFENKGYSRIVYPSTRMNLLGKKGRNVVLFNANDAEVEDGSLRILTK